MTLSAGQNGTPSTTASLITNVGLSPLILSVVGVIHEWITIGGVMSVGWQEQGYVLGRSELPLTNLDPESGSEV